MQFLKRTFTDFSEDNCMTLAAALAYYTTFALPSLLFLLLTVLTFGMSTLYSTNQAEEQAERTVQNQVGTMVGNQQISEEIAKIIDNHQKSDGAWWKTLVSIGGMIVGATGVVAALQAALNQAWEVKPDPEKSGIVTILWKRIFSLGMIIGLAFLLLVSLAVSTVLTGIGDQVGTMIGMSGTLAEVINYVVQALVVFAVFAAVFKFMPDAKVRWKDVGVGAAMTTVLYLAGRFAMQLYFQFSEPGAQFGSAAASLAVVLVWVYYTSLIVLLGAEATQTYAAMFGSGIEPEEHAVRVEETVQRAS